MLIAMGKASRPGFDSPGHFLKLVNRHRCFTGAQSVATGASREHGASPQERRRHRTTSQNVKI